MNAGETKAVFLSYTSQDAEAARRIADALRAAGIEVWFDQSELRGGDAWDQKIRRQIKECALFVPVISANTQARQEGYFRLEWHLAEQRSHLIARGRPFIVPVCVDATSDSDALVPDAFLALQWMRLAEGSATPAFGERIKVLLGGGEPAGRDLRIPPSSNQAGFGDPALQKTHSPRWLKPVLVGAGLAVAALGITLWQRSHAAGPAQSPAASQSAPATAEKLSPARELAKRASAVLGGGSVTRNQLAAAGELCDRARQLDPTDPIVWATAANTDLAWIYPRGYDVSLERRHRAEEEAARATALGPDLFEVRVTQARVLAHAVGTPAVLKEAEETLRDLRATHPDDRKLAYYLGEVLRQQGRYEEAAKLFEQIGEFEVAGWSYRFAGDGRAALAAVERSPRTVGSVWLKADLQLLFQEDPVKAQATIDQLAPSELLAQMPAATAITIAMYRRDWHRMLDLAQGLSEEYLDSNAFRGPRRFFTGLADEMAGRPALAESEWRAALAVIQTRLTAAPDDRQLLLWAAWLHAALNETAEGERLFARSQTIAGLNGDAVDFTSLSASLRLRHKDALLTWAEATLRTKDLRWDYLHSQMRYSPEWDWLRGDPRFEKLVRDHVPPGAKPLEPAQR